MSWRSFIPALLLVAATCLVLGAMIGAGSYFVTTGWTIPGRRWLFAQTLSGSYLGGISGLGASVGALVALIIVDKARRERGRPGAPALVGAALSGAGLGSAVPWLVIASGNIASGYPEALGQLAPVALGSIVAATVLTGAIVAARAAQLRRRSL